jgi:hypothetical protein
MGQKAAAVQRWEDSITSKLIIITTYFKSTAQCSGFLNNVLSEDGPVWPKHIGHKYKFYDIINILTNI